MEQTNDTSPDELMHHFRGRSLKSIIIFTIVIHIVIIGGTSVPFLIGSLTGPDTETMTEAARIELAVKEATSALQRIANEHGIRPQKLSEQLSGKRQPVAKEEAGASTPEPEVTPEEPAEPEAPKSEIEKQLEKAEPGPTLPPVDEAVDLFG